MTTSLFSAMASLTGLVAVSAATFLTMLILRNPRFPKLLRSEAVAHGASLVLTTGTLVAVVTAAAGLTAANLHYGIAIAVISGVQAASAYILWKAFGMGDRLAQADAGQSPFARRRQAPAAPVLALQPAATG